MAAAAAVAVTLLAIAANKQGHFARDCPEPDTRGGQGGGSSNQQGGDDDDEN